MPAVGLSLTEKTLKIKKNGFYTPKMLFLFHLKFLKLSSFLCKIFWSQEKVESWIIMTLWNDLPRLPTVSFGKKQWNLIELKRQVIDHKILFLIKISMKNKVTFSENIW